MEIIAGVKRGLADMDAGRLVSHEEAMDEIYALIDAATEEVAAAGRRP